MKLILISALNKTLISALNKALILALNKDLMCLYRPFIFVMDDVPYGGNHVGVAHSHFYDLLLLLIFPFLVSLSFV